MQDRKSCGVRPNVQSTSDLRLVRIGSTAISPVLSVRDLGVLHIDSDLTMRSHVVPAVQSRFAALRQISRVRRFLTLKHC